MKKIILALILSICAASTFSADTVLLSKNATNGICSQFVKFTCPSNEFGVGGLIFTNGPSMAQVTDADTVLSNALTAATSNLVALTSNAYVQADANLSNSIVAMYSNLVEATSNAYILADTALSNSLVFYSSNLVAETSNAYIIADSAVSNALDLATSNLVVGATNGVIGTINGRGYFNSITQSWTIVVQDITNGMVYWTPAPFGANACTLQAAYAKAHGATCAVDVITQHRTDGWYAYSTVATGVAANVTGTEQTSMGSLTNGQRVGILLGGVSAFATTNLLSVEFTATLP